MVELPGIHGIALWSFALYVQAEPFRPDSKLGTPIKLFNSRRLRLSGCEPYTRADPFLFAHGDTLFIFYETVLPKGIGKIACASTRDFSTYEDLGLLLDLPHHLSYPFVFADGDQIFMVPEAHQSGELALYRFTCFPTGLEKVRTLLPGPYVDSWLIRHEATWYLFATSPTGLEIFHAQHLMRGDFLPHKLNPIVTDPRFSRSGGGPILTDGKLVRVAQDCSRTYGSNISLIEITELGPDKYAERLLVADYFPRDQFWNKLGAHHLSVTEFRGRTIVAADGMHRDYAINRGFAALRRLGLLR